MSVKTPLCEAKSISIQFTAPDGHILPVLENIDLQVYPHEILAIIGPSGCGKSTLLRILAGLISPSAGQILYHGKPHKGLLPHFSFVFQSFALYPWMTVLQNIEMVLVPLGLSREEITKRALQAISSIGLSGFEESYPRELSGGMKQRVGLARAFVCNPELLLLDEPFSSLDAFTAETLREELLEIWSNKEHGINSIVLISHDVREVALLADRILMMEANPGRIHFVKENKLPRPRDYHSAELVALVDELHNAYSQEKAPHILEIENPLFAATPEEILNFLSYLRRHGESQNLYQIGTGSMHPFDRVLIRANAAKRLGFATLDHQIIALTQRGKKYVDANHHQRRILWREQLLAIPLFNQVIRRLQSSAKQIMSHQELVDLIAKELPHSNPQEQAKILISWGAYGNLWNYQRLMHCIGLKKHI